ncbi:MAG: HesA/MoeB/ThiF family protein [Phocaeicola sp.]
MEQNERYSRQIMLPEVGEAGQEKLKQAKVLIVGVGGLGSPIATYLAGAGVGTLGLVDDDVVSVSNLQRQVLYSEEEVGLPKVIQAKKRLNALNSQIQLNSYAVRLTPENAEDILSAYDIVVDGCDNFATRYLINDTCVKLGKVYVYGAIRAFDGQVSVFNYQGGPNYRHLYPNQEELLTMPSPPKGVIGVTPGVVGAVEATEVLKVIGGYGEVLSGKLWTIDLRTMQSHLIAFV